MTAGNLLNTTMQWYTATDYGSSIPDEIGETCAARLINMAQRAQQQLEQKRLKQPSFALTTTPTTITSPVKEATN